MNFFFTEGDDRESEQSKDGNWKQRKERLYGKMGKKRKENWKAILMIGGVVIWGSGKTLVGRRQLRGAVRKKLKRAACDIRNSIVNNHQGRWCD